MSNKTQNAKKAKTGSALSRGFSSLVYPTVGLFALLTLLMPPSSRLDGKKACFNGSCIKLEQASTAKQREKGLSGRAGLASRDGMLFVFDEPGKQCMWMKDMRFNLDMMWLDKNSRVIQIVRNISPATYPESFCAGPAQYVIELNAGTAGSLGWNLGDLIQL